jgi:hypothetical protein
MANYIYIYKKDLSHLEMLGMGTEAISKQKIILDRLGKSQKFLKTLLNLGTAASEVTLDGVEKNSLTNHAESCTPLPKLFLVRPMSYIR